MALFSFNKKKTAETKGVSAPAPAPRAAKTAIPAALQTVLKKPHITEKATAVAERNVYVFEIDPRAGKRAVADAVFALYQIHPRKVRIVRLPAKRTGAKGRHRGHSAGLKKAYVYLPSGATITLV